MLRAIIALLIATLLSSPVHAQQRVALVIGNQAYNASVGPLKNPHNDITVVGKALAEVGFKVLPPRKDATRDDILFAVHELAAQVRTAGSDAVSFLYYAGHGVGIGAENVLIPTNAENTTDAMLSVRGVRLSEILDILKREAPDVVHFVVLDACRNTLRGQRGARGFVPVNDRRTGVVIAFSTAQGETATDEGINSAPYAAALAKEIVKPGRNDQEVFNEVRARIVEITGQTPWTHDGLIGKRVVFKAPAPPAVLNVLPPPQQQSSEAERAWTLTKDTQNISALEAFIRRFGDTYYGDLAKVRLAELQRAEAARQADTERKKIDDLARAKAEAEVICINVEGISTIPLLNVMADQHKGTAAEECITTRIDNLKKQQATTALTPPVPKPATKPSAFSPTRAAKTLTLAEERALKPGDAFKECSICPEMVVVPAGEFLMGASSGETGAVKDEYPQRKVTIQRPFAVGKFEVTNAQWKQCVAGGGCKSNEFPQGFRAIVLCMETNSCDKVDWTADRLPVVDLDWSDAKEYVTWLSRKTGKAYRLLSEAEWEYAARAGTSTRYAWGNEIGKGNANCKGCGSRWDNVQVAPVGSFKPNAFGLHDMHGNVWEWVEDPWHPNYQGAPTDGSVWLGGDTATRITRGGGWSSDPSWLRLALRGEMEGSAPEKGSGRFVVTSAGLRVARTLD